MAGLHFDITGDNANFLRKLDEARNGVRSTSKQIEESGVSIEQMFGRLAKGAAAFGAGITAKEIVSNIVRVRGEFQQLEVAFKTMLGSEQKANDLMQQLVKTAATTPFDLQSVAGGAKQLLAYGDNVENVNEDLIRLGNIASGLSQPLSDLVYLYGTTMTQGRLYTADFNQFTGRGIPMIKELAKQFGVAESEVKGLVEAGKVGFPEVQKVIQSLTNEGGMFFNLMEEQSKTITGRISNIGDSISMMYNNIGKQSEGFINEALSGVSYLVENYEEIGKTVLELAAVYGAYKAVLITITALQKLNSIVLRQAAVEKRLAAAAGIALSNAEAVAAAQTKILTIAQVGLTKAVKSAATAMLANPYILIAAAIAGVSFAIYKVATAETELDKAHQRLNNVTKDVEKNLSSEVSKLTSLERKLAETKKGTEEYDSIKKAIVNNYGQYYKGLDGEIERVGNLSTVYGQLVEKMRLSIGQRKFESFFKAEQDNLDKTIGEKLDKAYETLIEKYGKTKGSNLYNQFFDSAMHGEPLSPSVIKDLQNATFMDVKWGSNAKDGIIDFRNSVFDLRSEIGKEKKAIKAVLDEYKSKFRITEEDFAKMLSGDSTSTSEQPQENKTLKQLLVDIDTSKAKIKELQEQANNGLISSDKIKEEQDVLSKLTSDYKNRTGLEYGSPKQDSASDSLRKSQVDNEEKLQKERVEAMADGRRKALAEIELDKKSRLSAIDEEERELSKRYKELGKVVPQNETDTFNTRRQVIKEGSVSKTIHVNKTYDNQEADYQRELTDVYLTENQKREQSIKSHYDNLRRLQKEVFEGEVANISKTVEQGDQWDESLKALMKYLSELGKIDVAENYESSEYKRDTYNSLVSQLDDFKSREYTLTVEWDKKIANAVDTGDQELINRTKEGKENAFSELNRQMLEQSDEWIKLFGDLDKLTTAEIDKLIAIIKAKSKQMKLSPIDEKVLIDGLEKAEDQIKKKNPFKSLIKHIKEYKEAQDDATKDDKLKDIFSDASGALGMLKDGFDSVIGGLEETGLAGDEVTQELIGNISNLIGSAGQLAGGIASGNIMGAVQGAVGMITSVVGFFNKDTKLQKSIEESERAVKKLGWAYEDLERAREKAEGDNKEMYANKMVRNLKDQQEELRKQIEDEKKKKKGDKGKIEDLGREVQVLQQQIEDLQEESFNEKFQANIEKSEHAVKKLEWAFDDLKRAMDRTLGEEKYSYLPKLFENIKQRQKELLDQINEESKKTNPDDKKLDELKREWEELNHQIEDTIDGIKDDFIGGSAQDIATRLGDAFIEAFARGEDAARAWNKSVKEIIGDIVKRMLITKFFEEPIGALITDLWNSIYGKDVPKVDDKPSDDKPSDDKKTDNSNRGNTESSKGDKYVNNRTGGTEGSSGRPTTTDRPGSSRPGSSGSSRPGSSGSSRPGSSGSSRPLRSRENMDQQTNNRLDENSLSNKNQITNSNNKPVTDKFNPIVMNGFPGVYKPGKPSNDNSKEDTKDDNSNAGDALNKFEEGLKDLLDGMDDNMKPFQDLIDKYLGGGEIEDGVSGQLQASMTEGTGSQLVGLWNMTALDIRELKNISIEGFKQFKPCIVDVHSIMEETRQIQLNTLRGANNTNGLMYEMRLIRDELGQITKNTKEYKGRG